MALNIPGALNALRALARRTAGRRPGVPAPRPGARDLDIRPAATEEEAIFILNGYETLIHK